MSITAETAKAHAHDPAVLCCRAEAGITIEPANLEDPAIFDDLVDSGLLNLDGCLTIEEVLGAKLTKTCDSLCPLTNDVLDGVKAPTTPAEEKAEEEAPAEEAAPAAPVATAATVAGGTLKIHIGEGILTDNSKLKGASGDHHLDVAYHITAAQLTIRKPVNLYLAAAFFFNQTLKFDCRKAVHPGITGRVAELQGNFIIIFPVCGSRVFTGSLRLQSFCLRRRGTASTCAETSKHSCR
jgi:hypothetical protein